MAQKIELTDEQWAKCVNLWNSRPDNPPSISELTEIAFGIKDLDVRSLEGRAVRLKLSKAGLTKAHADPQVVTRHEQLTPAQKEYITNNYQTQKPLEIAQILFAKALPVQSWEVRQVIKHIRSLAPEKSYENPNELAIDNYSPPMTTVEVLSKINNHRMEKLVLETLSGKQKKDTTALLGYLHNFRFIRQINIYQKSIERELFENTFIRYTFDKHDLTEEEVDQYIILSNEVINAFRVQSRIETLNKLLESASEDEDKRISMSLVEAIKTVEVEYDKCVIRQSKLLDSLKIKRSEKEGKGKEGVVNIINLVQLWKEEETRIKMIKLGEKKKHALKKGIEEYMEMDELIAKLAGVNIDEVLNG